MCRYLKLYVAFLLGLRRRRIHITMVNPEVYLASFPMEDFAYWLASFIDAHVVDTSVPCRFDIMLQMSCWQLPPQHHRFLLLRAQRVAKWCERRRKTRPNLPFFEVSGRFPRFWICCKSLEQHDAFDVLPNCIEMIAKMLAINLEYIEKRQQGSLSVSAETWKQSKRIQNMSLRQAMETKISSAQVASKKYVTELLVHIQEKCSVPTSTFLRDKM